MLLTKNLNVQNIINICTLLYSKSLELFNPAWLKVNSHWKANPDFLLLPGPGHYHCTFCLHELDYFRSSHMCYALFVPNYQMTQPAHFWVFIQNWTQDRKEILHSNVHGSIIIHNSQGVAQPNVHPCVSG